MVDQVIKLKRNTSNTNAPDTNDIVVGELAIGAVAGKLYLRKSDDSILTFSDDTNVSTTLTIAADSGSNDTVTVGTNTLTFNGTSNQIGTTVSDNAITIALADNPVVGGTGSIRVPDGTTGQRPGSPAAGMFRYNTTTSKFEGYTDDWGDIGGGGANTFTRNAYTGDGSTVAFTLSQSVNSENDLIVFIEGVFQDQDAYSVSGTTLTFDTAPVNGRGIIVYSVKHTVAGSNLNIDTMTGDGSDTTLALTISPNDENNTQVFIDGVYQNKSTYSISGSTLTFSAAPPNGSAVECMTFTQTDVNEATYVTANANNSTNETVFPIFVDGATGKQEVETDTGFTYNPSTGVLTSTSFAGQVTTAAQTNITSLFATDIKIGEDDQTKIDFETADEIHFYAANAHQIKLVDGALAPATNNDIDLGTSSLEFKNAFFDGAVTADSFVGPLTGNADTASIATAATNVTASANNSTDETVYLTFVDGTTGSQGIETDSGLTYNPSSGLLTITGELDAGSLDISGDADIDGTLETDALSINGTAVSSTAAELNILDGATVVVGEINALDLGSTAVGTAIASKAVILDSNKDYTGLRNLTITGELDAATLDISGNADIDGTLETDNLTVGGAQGSDGQVLTSTGSGVAWEDAAGGTDPDGAQTFNDSGNDVDFRVESNNNADMLFVDGGNDNVLLGTQNQGHVRLNQQLGMAVTGNVYGGISMVTHSSSAGGNRPLLDFNRSRNTTIGSHTVVNSGDSLGTIVGRGDDGDEFLDAASIDFEVDGTPGDGDMPGRIVFATTADGAGSVTERLRITSGGNIGFGLTGPTFASGNGMHFADAYKAGFGTGNGTRPDFQISGDNNGLAFACGTGSDDADVLFTTAGNVGIGTTSPGQKLHIFQTEGSVGAKHATIRLGGYSTTGAEIAAYRASGNSNDQGLVFSSHDSSNGVVDRMTINQNGQITMAAQPRFDAGRNAGYVTDDQDFIQDQVRTNIGSHYDNSNGRFTAPVAGDYLFSFRIFTHDSGSVVQAEVTLKKNGSDAFIARAHKVGGYHTPVQLTKVLTLAANDYVNTYVGDSGTSSGWMGSAGEYNYFSGFLIG